MGKGNSDITLNDYSFEVPITKGNATSVENALRFGINISKIQLETSS